MRNDLPDIQSIRRAGMRPSIQGCEKFFSAPPGPQATPGETRRSGRGNKIYHAEPQSGSI